MTVSPKTLPEWSAYVQGLECAGLFEKVERANSISFVRQLKEDGLTAKEITSVFECFVRRLLDCGERPPAGGYYDLTKMMEVLSVRPDPTGRFSNRAEAYARARPGYPDAAIDHLLEATGIGPRGSIVDLGAGTGLLSRPLLDRGYEVVLVEPNAAMADAAASILGDRGRIVRAPAEATTLAPASVDLAVAGQAFHWFDADRTAAELRRILRPGGGLALLWHRRSLSGTPFLAAYEAFLAEWGVDYAEVKQTYERRDDLETVFGGKVPEPAHFEYAQRLDQEGLLERILSCSYMPGPEHPRHPAMREAAGRLFAAHAQAGKVVLSYDTVVYAGRLQA